MLKNIMICFFAGLALLILVSAFVSSGKGLFLASPNKDLVYELRVRNGSLQHALRHGGAQVVRWSPLVVEGENLKVEKIAVKKADHKKREYVVSGFSNGILLNVRVQNDRVRFYFSELPAGNFSEKMDIAPEKGSSLVKIVPDRDHPETIGAAAPKIKGACYVFCASDSLQKIEADEDGFVIRYERDYAFDNAIGNALAPHEICVIDDASALAAPPAPLPAPEIHSN